MLHGSRSFSNFSWAIKFFLCANWRMVCPVANASCAIFAPVADHGRQVVAMARLRSTISSQRARSATMPSTHFSVKALTTLALNSIASSSRSS